MNIRQLQAFLAVADAMSFASAANQLHVSQPALSIAIKGLEDDLGGKLLTRTTRTLSLTAEGKALVPLARRLLAQWANAEDEMRQRFELHRGKITIAAMPSFAALLLPKAIRNYHHAYPNIQIAIEDVLTDNVIQMVQTHQVELGVSFEPEPNTMAGLNFYPLYEDRFIAILPKHHPLEEEDYVTWDMLLAYDFITLQRPSSIRSLIEDRLGDADIHLHVAFDAHHLATIGRMVSEGIGVAVVPALCRQQAIEQGALCRPLTQPEICRQVGVICQPRSQLSVAAAAMLDVLIKTYKH